MMRPSLLFFLFLTCHHAYSEINEGEFASTLNSFRTSYTPKIQDELGLKLRLESYWTKNSMLVSSQARKLGDEAIIFIDGDLAKQTTINTAAFVISVCHEFGHIYLDHPGELKLTREGNADYWAASCVLEFFSSKQDSPNDVPTVLAEPCHSLPSAQYDACMHVASGINAFAKTYNIRLENGIDETENDRVKSGAFHPHPLCRVKTFIAGLFGEAKPRCIYDVKPGIKD